MSEEEILKGIKKYFDIRELVGKPAYNKHGDRAWKFFDFRLLETLLIVRIGLGRSITINNWKWGGKFQQRGLRTNIGAIVLKMIRRMKLYLSGHVLGMAVDFDVEGMTAQEVRQWLVDNQDLLPYKIRLERKLNGKYISWTHMDLIWEAKNPKVYLFNV